MHKHIYELVNAGLEHFIIIIYNKIQFHTFSLTHFWHTSGKMLILEQNFELIKLWQLCLAPTHLLYMSQFFKKKKLGFEPKPTHLFGQCHEICSFFFWRLPLENIVIQNLSAWASIVRLIHVLVKWFYLNTYIERLHHLISSMPIAHCIAQPPIYCNIHHKQRCQPISEKVREDNSKLSVHSCLITMKYRQTLMLSAYCQL